VKRFMLFVCSQAMIRSRTAEVLCLLGGLPARCAGTAEEAFVPVNDALLDGASEVVCMEREHADFVRGFRAARGRPVCSLGIPDEFEPFSPALVEQLVAALRSRAPEAAQAVERGFALMVERKLDFNGDGN
jgi:predicted protein tyrosine phosphatase